MAVPQPISPSISPAPEAVLTAEQFQAILRALADPRRFSILEQIAQQGGPDGLLCARLDVKSELSPATISHHLHELQDAGLIDGQREGRQMRLTLRHDVWSAYLARLGTLASDVVSAK